MNLATLQKNIFSALQTSVTSKWSAKQVKFINAGICNQLPLTALQRVQIYRNMYYLRLRDSLRDDYSTLYKFLGQNKFDKLIEDYLEAYPSTHFSLKFAGRSLPKFLLKHSLNKNHPFLADLALFEWLLNFHFDSADSNVFTLNQAKLISPDLWPNLRLNFIAAHELMPTLWPVGAIYNFIRQTKTNDLPHKKWRKKKTTWLIWRKNESTWFNLLSEFELELYQLVLQKTPFAEICVALAKKHGQATTSKIATVLQSWLAEDLLVKI